MKQIRNLSLSTALCLSLVGSTPVPALCAIASAAPQSTQWVSVDAKPSFCVSTKDVRSPEGVRGVRVEKVNNPASQLHIGDVILSVDGQDVGDGETLNSLIAKKQIGETVKAKINRDGTNLSLVLTVLGEEQSSALTPIAGDVAPLPPGSGPKVKLAAATELKLVLEETVSSNKSKANDSINYTVQDDVKGPDGVVLIRKGAKAGGTVTAAKGAGGFGRKGKLEFTAEWVETVDGQRAVLRTSQTATGKGQQGVAVAAFVFLSILGGFIKGKNATVNKGTVIPAFIDRDIEVASVPAAMPVPPTPATP